MTGFLILTFALLTVGVSWWATRADSLVLLVCSRWLRWLMMAIGGAWLLGSFGWVTGPFWSVALMLFAFWFLLESAYNWIAIRALSKSDLPLFPSYSEVSDGSEWPASTTYINLRDRLRDLEYRKISGLRATIQESIFLRSTVFESRDRKTRIQVLFIPQRNGRFTSSLILSTPLRGGGRIITDNFFLPFGGFYPTDWHLERLPLNRSLARLLRRHGDRVAAAKDNVTTWQIDPATDINQQQAALERLNEELGFLNPRAVREDDGKLTWPARYRLWQELWTLSYLGQSRRY